MGWIEKTHIQYECDICRYTQEEIVSRSVPPGSGSTQPIEIRSFTTIPMLYDANKPHNPLNIVICGKCANKAIELLKNSFLSEIIPKGV